MSTTLLNVLGKQSFRACKGDPCCQPGSLLVPNLSATCRQKCLPTPTRTSTGTWPQTWGTVLRCKSGKPLPSLPGTSILPWLPSQVAMVSSQ